MSRRLSVDDWLNVEHSDIPDGSWLTMMSRVASFHHKHRFSSEENHGHDMGFRIALTVEELGELSAAITKGKPDEEAAEELADLLILILGHSLAMEVDPRRRVPQEDGQGNDEEGPHGQARYQGYRVLG